MHFTCSRNYQFAHSNHLKLSIEIPQIVDPFELSQSYASFKFYHFISYCFNRKQSSENTGWTKKKVCSQKTKIGHGGVFWKKRLKIVPGVT